MKYSWEFKLECVNKYKKGVYIETPQNCRSRAGFLTHVYVWAKNYDDFGIDGLKHSSTNKNWTPGKRFALVAKVLAGNPIRSVAKNAHIDSGQLYRWVRRYNEKGMDGLQCKKGRPSEKIVMKKKTKNSTLSISEQEELKLLKERNEYLEMENEYLKKLDALVSEREAAEARAKKQK
jgi:transposase-like protein